MAELKGSVRKYDILFFTRSERVRYTSLNRGDLPRLWVGGLIDCAGPGRFSFLDRATGSLIHATRLRNGRTVSCIPIARKTARKLFSSGFPFGDSVR